MSNKGYNCIVSEEANKFQIKELRYCICTHINTCNILYVEQEGSLGERHTIQHYDSYIESQLRAAILVLLLRFCQCLEESRVVTTRGCQWHSVIRGQ